MALNTLTVKQVESKIAEGEYVLAHPGNYALAVVEQARKDVQWWNTILTYSERIEFLEQEVYGDKPRWVVEVTLDGDEVRTYLVRAESQEDAMQASLEAVQTMLDVRCSLPSSVDVDSIDFDAEFDA